MTLVMVRDSNDACGLINVRCIPAVWLLIGQLGMFPPSHWLIRVALSSQPQINALRKTWNQLYYKYPIIIGVVAKTWFIEAWMTCGIKFDNCFHSSGRRGTCLRTLTGCCQTWPASLTRCCSWRLRRPGTEWGHVTFDLKTGEHPND